MSAVLVSPGPSPDAAESRKRRFQSGDCAEEVLPKRRYAEARRLLDWVAHLCLRYPLMTDKEITQVLDSCGGDVEATIRRLDELSLSMAARDAAGAAGGGAGPGGGLQGDGGVAGDAVAPQPHADAAAAAPPSVAESWVDVVVQEMAASADLSDARARAARLLTAFEAAVRGGGGCEADSLRGALDSVLRDNAILKRAVAIQNARQQEAAAAAEAQVAELRAALAAQGSQLAAAQMSAYSLSVHLREALAGQGQHTHQPRHPPDVC